MSLQENSYAGPSPEPAGQSGKIDVIEEVAPGNIYCLHLVPFASIPPFKTTHGAKEAAPNIRNEGVATDISQEGTARTMEGDRVFSYDEAAGTKFEKMSTVQSASLYNQDPDINPALRHYVTDLCLQCTTEGVKFSPFDTVSLVIFELKSEDGHVVELEKEVGDTWKQASIIEISADVDDLTIVVTSQDSNDFAHVYLTKDELTLGLKTDTQITKNLTSDAGAPSFNLSLMIKRMFPKDAIREYLNDEELLETARAFRRLGVQLAQSFGSTANQAEINEAIVLLHCAVQLTPNGHADMPGHLSNLGSSYLYRFQWTGDLSDISEAISAQRRAIQLVSKGHADIPGFLNNLGNSLSSRLRSTGDLSDLSEAISAQQQAVQLTPEGHANAAAFLNNLGISLQSRFERMENISDISEAILCHRRAVQLTHNGDEDMASRLMSLGISFQYRFKHSNDLSDISEAILAQQRAIKLTPEGHADMPSWLSNLGVASMYRFKRKGDLPDISEAIAAQQRAVQLTPNGHEEMPARLNNLAISFVRRFNHTGDLPDISAAIAVQQRAIRLTPDGHEGMPLGLTNLANALQARFGWTGDLSDLSEAVSSLQRAIHLTPTGDAALPLRLSGLGIIFLRRYDQTGDFSDLSEAVSFQQRAVRLSPAGHPDLPGWLNNLGDSLRSRFERTGNISDISEAISVGQQAVQLTPHDHPDMSSWLGNLGFSFQRRFERKGDLSDISEAISVQQRAVQLTPDGHVDMAAWLNNLGNAFQFRFKRTGDLSDLSSAISSHQRAVQLTPDGHADMPKRLNNLGNSLQCRFERTGDLSDILEAISAHQRTGKLIPDGHTDMPMHLNNLGNSFLYRFQRTGDLSDLSEAISAQQRAVKLTPNGHANLPLHLCNLGGYYMHRFQRTGDLSDLAESISVQQRAVQLTPDGHAAMTLHLNNLGLSFQSRFEHTGESSDYYTTLHLFEKSAKTLGPPSVRLTAARAWAQISMTHDPSAAMDAYGIAIDLIAQIAGMHRTVEQRHTNLIDISDLTTAAASAAFAQGEIEKALEWLEQARCLIWSQLKQLRTPVDDLRAHEPDLAQRFLNISSALESSGSRRGSGSLSTDAPMSEKITLQEEAHMHIKLAAEWDQLLEQIRRIPAFRDFLRPTRSSDLLNSLPPEGPIILVNVHEDRCDALALISGSDAPIHIPLPEFTHGQASELRDRLHSFLLSHRVRIQEEDRGGRPVKIGERSNEKPSDMHFVLEALWLSVVRPILDGLSYPTHSVANPARIWWCPTGPLAFLPLHAAGIYAQSTPFTSGSCLADFAISSYTPTVSSLLGKIRRPADELKISLSKLLIVSQPKTKGLPPIPGTTIEMNAISTTLGSNDCESLCLEGEAATISRVQLEMESHSSIHFACHAKQDIDDPLKSGFYLHNGRLELADIIRQNISHCQLAFLSACQTSTGDERLSEEAVHLAAGMLAVGYKGVVATMWSIADQYGAEVAEGFYKHLMDSRATSGTPGIDSVDAARALRQAIQGIRERVGDTEQGLVMWVPYVHFGY